ncbi:hypothetical protein [Rhodoblastus sp.]|uniref:hypothetical protein n=1 Tax=Rhodoblastus sp. TaxID=1962975 RepID=UPI0025DEC6F1|nr:hypothetical protein [Rhodoblastus sp.]
MTHSGLPPTLPVISMAGSKRSLLSAKILMFPSLTSISPKPFVRRWFERYGDAIVAAAKKPIDQIPTPKALPRCRLRPLQRTAIRVRSLVEN